MGVVEESLDGWKVLGELTDEEAVELKVRVQLAIEKSLDCVLGVLGQPLQEMSSDLDLFH